MKTGDTARALCGRGWAALLAPALAGLLLMAGCSPEGATPGAAEEEPPEVALQNIRLKAENIIVEEPPATELILQGPRGFVNEELLAVLRRELNEQTGGETRLSYQVYTGANLLKADLLSQMGGDLVLAPQELLPELRRENVLHAWGTGTGRTGDEARRDYQPYLRSALAILTVDAVAEGSAAADRWSALFNRDPGRYPVTWFCSPRRTLAAAMLSRNLSPNMMDSVSLEPVLAMLRETQVLEDRPLAAAPSVILQENPNGRVVALTHMVPSLVMENPGISMTIPEEGTIQFQLGWIIPEPAPHAATALDLLEILARPEVVARFAWLNRMSPADSPRATEILRERHPHAAAVNLPLTRTYYLLEPFPVESPAFQEALELVRGKINGKDAPTLNPLDPPSMDAAQEITLPAQQTGLLEIVQQSAGDDDATETEPQETGEEQGDQDEPAEAAETDPNPDPE